MTIVQKPIGEPILTADRISLAFGGITALSGISLEIRRRVQGPGHPSTQTLLYEMARQEVRLGNRAQAVARLGVVRGEPHRPLEAGARLVEATSAFVAEVHKYAYELRA